MITHLDGTCDKSHDYEPDLKVKVEELKNSH